MVLESKEDPFEPSFSMAPESFIPLAHEDSKHSDGNVEFTTTNILQTLLDSNSHMNLSDKVYAVSPVMKGHGGYSDVFTGYCELAEGASKKVAVKRLRVHVIGDKKFQKKLGKELHIWSKLNHPNVLHLLGFFLEDNNYPSLVSEWMENGTVMKYLEAHPETDILHLVWGIASGIDYLHTKDVIHSDIKPDNILISQTGNPLLCDFGISRTLASSMFQFSSTISSELRGTIRYMSPELFGGLDSEPTIHSKESDTWAFGMTILALLTGRQPYCDISANIKALFAIVNGSLPPRPVDFHEWTSVKKTIWHIGSLCWMRDRDSRPPMSVITSWLADIAQSFVLEPFFAPVSNESKDEEAEYSGYLYLSKCRMDYLPSSPVPGSTKASHVELRRDRRQMEMGYPVLQKSSKEAVGESSTQLAIVTPNRPIESSLVKRSKDFLLPRSRFDPYDSRRRKTRTEVSGGL